MNNTTRFTLAVVTTATILGASGVITTTSAHADIRKEATAIGTESGISTDVERYIGI